MRRVDLTDRLMDSYCYWKAKIAEDAGARGRVDTDRLRQVARPRIEAMAATVEGWDAAPHVIMSAAFEWALHNRHPDGPMPNLLASQKYLTKALGHYLQVPYEVVAEKKSMSLFFEKMDDAHARFRAELERAGVTDMSSSSSYPPENRYLIALGQGDRGAMFMIAHELLARMQADGRVESWLAHRGVAYAAVARLFNDERRKRATNITTT